MKNRLNYIDIAKAFGMMFVVIAHAYVPYLREIGYVFMVPIFFFLNGYVFNLKEKEIDLKFCKDFIIKRLKSLWLIFLLYHVVYILLHNTFLSIGLYTDKPEFLEISENLGKTVLWGGSLAKYYNIKDILIAVLKTTIFYNTEQLMRPLWFIPSLFTADIVYVVINYIASKLKMDKVQNIAKVSLVFGIFVLGYCTHFPLYTSTGLVGVLLLYIGNLAKKYEEKINYNGVGCIICIIIVIVLAPCSHVGMMSNTYTSPITFLGGTLCGTYAILYISKKIDNLKENNKLKRYLIFFGRNTFIVLALHLTCFKLVTIIEILITKSDWMYLACYPVYETGWIYSILYTIAGISIPTVLKYIQLSLKKYFTKDKITKYNLLNSFKNFL